MVFCLFNGTLQSASLLLRASDGRNHPQFLLLAGLTYNDLFKHSGKLNGGPLSLGPIPRGRLKDLSDFMNGHP